MAAWRYQPVWTEHEGERTYSLCEVYFDKNNKLEMWTENPRVIPMGTESIQDLRNDLTHMLTDAYKWRPVEFAKLKIGMTFERAVTQEQMDQIADMVDAVNDAAKAAETSVN